MKFLIYTILLILVIFSIQENTKFVTMQACNMPDKKWGYYHYMIAKSEYCQDYFYELEVLVHRKEPKTVKQWLKLKEQDLFDFKKGNGL